MKVSRCLLAVLVPCVILASPSSSVARRTDTNSDRKGFERPDRILVIDGSNVHNVGELHMHVSNWGIFGSHPNTARRYSEQPSAQWPAGSGVEYLWIAGLWVGGLKNGVPAVSTAAFDEEFWPTADPIDIVYRAAEGAAGGNRRPSPDADDDKDGLVDEDWLNGRDDDLDGKIDEDFAAVSTQMFSCWYTDDQTFPQQRYPEHNPLHVMVRQESYQWEEDRFDDFVGIEYKITNIGSDILEEVYVGFFSDPDVGPRDRDDYSQDDATGHVFVPVSCTELGPVQLDIAYAFDPDTDEGQTMGYFGVMFLGHTTDPTGELAPTRVGISTYANFSGGQPFEAGGDPNNDFEAYELLSQQVIERDQFIPRDYRMLVSAGPFAELSPGSTLVFQVAFAAGPRGNGLSSVLENFAAAQLTFDGAWFNLDGNALTGIDGRETPVVGPGPDVAIDTCRLELRVPVPVPRNTTIWINNDCASENLFNLACGYAREDTALFRTGIGGNESQLHWIIGTAPPPPKMRVDERAADGVVIYWDNFSETVPDVKSQIHDFEGYRVWRADNWSRPIGTNIDNGPESHLWKLLFEADIINNLGLDSGLDQYRYEPLMHVLTATKKRDFINSMKQWYDEFPIGDPPCPQGVTDSVCDTLKALAAWELGIEGGRQYYKYVDRSMHLGRPYFYAVTALDHGFDPDDGRMVPGKVGDPSSNFTFVEPRSVAQPAYNYREGEIYVVPNPATTESMRAWALSPNNDDPTGTKVEFRNLPMSPGTVRIYTLSGDLVEEIRFDGRTGVGTAEWNLVSRNGQDVTSGVFIYSVETSDKNFDRFIGKFVVIR